MELGDLKFSIKDNTDIVDEETIRKAYHNLFLNMYGMDLIESVAFISQTREDEILKHVNKNGYADNSIRVNKLIDEIKNNSNNKLLYIYLNNYLIGVARILRIDALTARVKEVALISLDINIMRDVWMNAILHVQKYLLENGYKKMYLEIPLKEGVLLRKSYEMGFIENPKDIVVDDLVYTYVLNKTLEGNYE